ncbi:protoporphyrinogen oxidase [Perkinsela sp. CCAP 1560/4]|nr:protoporphyrinogen oxidase [Perkinsela sp. CCAP 1560/4]|eukprot:KNH04887.1 protoporphyrinogen oxidase [Perkinsela sp. CCAP 1560/4]
MNDHRNSPHIVILGGGLAGLSALHTLRGALPSAIGDNAKITLIEAAESVGGKVKSLAERGPDGSVLFWHDLGPHSFRTQGRGEVTLRLVRELGIADQLVRASPSSASRLVFSKGAMQKVTWMFALSLAGWKSVIRHFRLIFCNIHATTLLQSPSLSVHRALHVLVGRNFADVFGNSLARGIYAGDAHDLTMIDAFPVVSDGLRKYLQNPWSFLIKPLLAMADWLTVHCFSQVPQIFKWTSGKSTSNADQTNSNALSDQPAIYSFRNGMHQLPMAIHKAAHSDDRVTFMLGKTIRKIYKVSAGIDDRQLLICLENDETVCADYVVCALPSSSMLEIFVNSRLHTSEFGALPACDTEIEKILCTMKYRSVHVVNYFAKTSIGPHSNAFGYLTHQADDPVLGVIFDSKIFPSRYPEGSTVCTAMLRPSYALTKNHALQHGVEANLCGDFAQEKYYHCFSRIAFERAFRSGAQANGGFRGLLRGFMRDAQQSPCAAGMEGEFHHYDWLHAIPQYTSGHYTKVKAMRDILEEHCPEITLCGCSYDGVSVNDAIYSGIEQAKRLVTLIERRGS